MLRLTKIIGKASDPTLSERLHELAHHGCVEVLHLTPDEAARHRIRRATDAGTDCGIVLRRDRRLFDGAVLCLDSERAIVVRIGSQEWMKLRPLGARAALELGYLAGNLHWRIRFEGDCLHVAVSTTREDCVARMKDLLDQGRLEIIDA